eukprot:CAMPEP_0113394176 /NCGR_PEP_ID=MMETSP0013_2-20120614/12344_1 /TAXON_ID=2843 ORGANISM="Skeletonema costatum, Strain 1716" /NCGR_SAMPLE_ID=MMETSP0013_2 /ASSEMBLY_ACC=CAM_ASM_000158 /LENGTH=369 /DNA_ID=CAMNT_0000277949 /DNA_START=71 /DNA_END=1180 /DNA_ORIENTATION=- /assembly_acc=CAM_ASM_000158
MKLYFALFLATTVNAFVPSTLNRCGTSLHSEPFHEWGPARPNPASPPSSSSPSRQSANPNRPPPAQSPSYEDPPSVDLGGQVRSRESNLFHPSQSVQEDSRPFDMNRRFSQRPDPYSNSNEARRAWWDSAPSDRVQGGSRSTYAAPVDRDMSHVFLETDGRPLDAEFEVWDGPNNTPTRMKVYSEDGRMRPINAFVENPQKGRRGETLTVKNSGPMEFPLNAGVGSVGEGLAGTESPYMSENDLRGFRRPTPSTKRGQRVQGGALKTFPLDYSVEAAQVTITTEGMPMNAKVELWGTSSHIKQVAEIYNDDGKKRPFACIIDVPGGSNTIAVYNEGPMTYPIDVVVEPVARMEGWDGTEQKFGGSLAPW